MYEHYAAAGKLLGSNSWAKASILVKGNHLTYILRVKTNPRRYTENKQLPFKKT